MIYSPIAMFVYKRPEQTRLALESLSKNAGSEESILYVYSDGAKSALDQSAVNSVRDVIKSKQWCKEVHLIERNENWGLFKSIVSGVSELTNNYGRVIVLEDDLLVSTGFIDYMNRALTKYCDVEKVMQVSGHTFPFNDSETNDAYFIPIATCQGWATWQRAWKHFDPNASGYEELMHNKDMQKKFDVNGSYPYTKMLRKQKAGKINSWAIYWWWAVHKNQGLCLYPKNSLVYNIGFGAGASHTQGADSYYNDPLWSNDQIVNELPDSVLIDNNSYFLWQKYISSRNALPRKLINRIIEWVANLC